MAPTEAMDRAETFIVSMVNRGCGMKCDMRLNLRRLCVGGKVEFANLALRSNLDCVADSSLFILNVEEREVVISLQHFLIMCVQELRVP